MPSVEILLPVGRIVGGHPRRPRKRMEDDGRTPRLRDGKEIMEYGFAFAIPKADFPPVAAAMGQAAAGIEGNNRPDFAWKVRDGDTGLDGEGKPLNQKPGYAGNMVLWIGTEIENLIKVYQRVDATTWREMAENEVSTGDYVQPKIVIEGHGKKPGVANSKPGLYLNPQGIQFVGYGEKIFSGVDPKAMFGDAPAPALPAGASATPIPSSGSVAAPMPAAPVAFPGGPSPAAAPAGFPGGFAPAPAAAPVAFPGGPSPVPAFAPAPAGFPQPGPAPAVAPTFTPSPGPQPAPGFAPGAVPAMPSPSPAGFPSPAPTASPSSPVMPAHDFVQAAQRQPIAFDPNNGRPIFGYQPGTNRPIYGFDPSGQWPILGFDAAGNPTYQ